MKPIALVNNWYHLSLRLKLNFEVLVEIISSFVLQFGNQFLVYSRLKHSLNIYLNSYCLFPSVAPKQNTILNMLDYTWCDFSVEPVVGRESYSLYSSNSRYMFVPLNYFASNYWYLDIASAEYFVCELSNWFYQYDTYS